MSDDEIKALRADAELLGLIPNHDTRNAIVYYGVCVGLGVLGVLALVWTYI